MLTATRAKPRPRQGGSPGRGPSPAAAPDQVHARLAGRGCADVLARLGPTVWPRTSTTASSPAPPPRGEVRLYSRDLHDHQRAVSRDRRSGPAAGLGRHSGRRDPCLLRRPRPAVSDTAGAARPEGAHGRCPGRGAGGVRASICWPSGRGPVSATIRPTAITPPRGRRPPERRFSATQPAGSRPERRNASVVPRCRLHWSSAAAASSPGPADGGGGRPIALSHLVTVDSPKHSTASSTRPRPAQRGLMVRTHRAAIRRGDGVLAGSNEAAWRPGLRRGGRRSRPRQTHGVLSDYTFAVRDDRPIVWSRSQGYTGLTDAEIAG